MSQPPGVSVLTILAIRRSRVAAAFAPLDGGDVFALKGESEGVEGSPRTRHCGERSGQVGRQLDGPWGRVQNDVDVDGLACGDPGRGAVLGAHRDHEGATHPGDRGAVAVIVDCDGDGRALAAAEALDHIRGNLEAGRRLPAQLESGAKLHGGECR